MQHVIYAAPQLIEGSMWGLSDPDATIVYTCDNVANTLQINDWVRRQGNDPWRGIEATVVRGPTIRTEHHALLTVPLCKTSQYWAHQSGFGEALIWHQGNAWCQQKHTIFTTHLADLSYELM